MDLKPFVKEMEEIRVKMVDRQDRIQEQVLYALSMLEFVLQ
jgi:hypothetical protein